jgi:hypothetical protein
MASKEELAFLKADLEELLPKFLRQLKREGRPEEEES